MPTFVPEGGVEAKAEAREEQRNEALEQAKAEYMETQRRVRAVEARKAASGEVNSLPVILCIHRLDSRLVTHSQVSHSHLHSPTLLLMPLCSRFLDCDDPIRGAMISEVGCSAVLCSTSGLLCRVPGHPPSRTHNHFHPHSLRHANRGRGWPRRWRAG